MAKNSALNIDVTPGGSATITFPSATGTLATLAGTEALSNKTLTLSSGTTAIAPVVMTSGTNLTTATAGALEYDGKVFYGTPVASARSVLQGKMYSIVTSGNFALSTATGVQSCFPAAGDVWTLAASTSYLFEGQYQITRTGSTTATLAMAFALGGGASVTKINYWAVGMINAKNTTATAQSSAYVDQVASTVVLATTTAGYFVNFNGIIRMNAGGTVTPQINFSANPTGATMIAGSYIAFTPIGSNTQDQQGNVA